MFKEDELPQSSGAFERPLDDLSLLTESQLRSLRAEIDELLPNTKSMNLHQELADQYKAVKKFQEEVLYSGDLEDEPQKVASVMNAVTSTLGQLIKMQENLERIETFKKMEACLIEALNLLPEETREKFFDDYENLARERGLV